MITVNYENSDGLNFFQIDSSDTSSQEKAKMEYIRLSLPVKCADKLMRSK